MKDQSVTVCLRDAEDNTYSFEAGFDAEGTFFEGKSTGYLASESTSAEFGFLTIDGNGWRDIECGGYLEDFLRDVVFGDRDAEEYLSFIAEALGVREPGQVL